MAKAPFLTNADMPLLKKARERYKHASDADKPQAQRERDDLAFYADDQWPVDVKLARMGQQPVNGMPAVPARPTLVINKVKEPVRQILNQERAADIGIELVPADDFGDLGIVPDDTEIELREGLIRRIQRDSHAADARTWAFSRAVQAGRGYYLVMTRFLPGKTWDQEIYLHRIYNQAGVVLDPAHEAPDGSDADYGFVGTWMPWDRYRSEYTTLADGAENPFADYSENDFMGLTEEYPDWYKSEGEYRAVRVVDYWYTERTPRTLVLLPDGSSAWEDEIHDGGATQAGLSDPPLGDVEAEAAPPERRTVVEKQIKFCKIGGGVQILEQTDWNGPDMPIIKVLGEELQPYDSERRAIGMIRPARDAQMGFNYMVSKQVETIGLTPIPPLQVDPDAIDGFEAWYASMNTRTLPYLPARTWDDEGRQLAAPHRPAIDPNILPIAQSISLFDASIKSTTAVPDPTLGNVDPTLKSGRAIREVVANAQQSTSNFLDNLMRSETREATVINNLLYPIYGGRPGRLVRIMTGDGEHQRWQIGDPQADAQQAMVQQAQKVAKLTKDANFNVLIKLTKNSENRRQQLVQTLGDLISADPQQMAVSGDILYKNMDIPEARELAERQRAMLAPPVQALLAAKAQGQPFDPAAQAKISALQQQIQHAEAAMQELSAKANGNQLDAQTKVQIEQMRTQLEAQRVQMEVDRDIRLQEMKDATSVAVAKINLMVKGVIADQEATDEAIALGQQHAFEAVEAERARQHDQQMATAQMAHAAAMGAGQQDHDAQMQAQNLAAQPAPEPSAQGDGAGV